MTLTSNRLPTVLQFWHMQAQCQILKSWQEHIFLHLSEWNIVLVKGKLFISHSGAQLASFCTENRNLPGFYHQKCWLVFAVEICDFSVFTYNFYSFIKIYRCWINKFCTEKVKNALRKLLNLRNKHSVFVPIAAIFILERNLISADLDLVLGNHFWATSACHTINKTTL